MTVDTTVFFGIIKSLLTIILLVASIVLILRLIRILDKADRILDDVEQKVNTLNGLFNVINKTTTSIDLISNKVATTITNVFGKIFNRKKEEDDYYE